MIDASAPSLSTPLWRRLGAWAGERFPAQNGILVLVVWALGLGFGRALSGGGPLSLPAVDLLAFPALWAYFLLLRVFDEHKDYELDLLNHPGRVLQSGQITLAHLRALGWGAVALQLAVSIAVDHGIGRVCAMWALLMVWTLLMLREFFVQWSPRYFVLYAFMHMLSMPLTLLWLAQIGAGGTMLAPGTRWLALLGGLIGATLEVARKFRAPADERPTIDTYTGQLGVRGASLTLSGLVVGAVAAAAALLATVIDVPAAAYVGLGLAAVPAISAAARFADEPSAERATLIETAAAISVLLVCVVALIALAGGRGL